MPILETFYVSPVLTSYNDWDYGDQNVKDHFETTKVSFVIDYPMDEWKHLSVCRKSVTWWPFNLRYIYYDYEYFLNPNDFTPQYILF